MLRVWLLVSAVWAVGYVIWARTYADLITWFTFDRDDVLSGIVEQGVGGRLQRDFWMVVGPPVLLPLLAATIFVAGRALVKWLRHGFSMERDDERS